MVQRRMNKRISVSELVALRDEMRRRWRDAPRHSDLRLELGGAIRGLGMAIAAAISDHERKGPRARRAHT
jgi:hypothetical protein